MFSEDNPTNRQRQQLANAKTPIIFFEAFIFEPAEYIIERSVLFLRLFFCLLVQCCIQYLL